MARKFKCFFFKVINIARFARNVVEMRLFLSSFQPLCFFFWWIIIQLYFWEFGKIFGWRNEPSGNSHPTTHHVLAEFFARSWRKLKTMRWQTSNPISGHKKVKHPSSSNFKSSITRPLCLEIIQKISLDFSRSNVWNKLFFVDFWRENSNICICVACLQYG